MVCWRKEEITERSGEKSKDTRNAYFSEIRVHVYHGYLTCSLDKKHIYMLTQPGKEDQKSNCLWAKRPWFGFPTLQFLSFLECATYNVPSYAIISPSYYNRVNNPYKTAGLIIILYILIFIFLYMVQIIKNNTVTYYEDQPNCWRSVAYHELNKFNFI